MYSVAHACAGRVWRMASAAAAAAAGAGAGAGAARTVSRAVPPRWLDCPACSAPITVGAGLEARTFYAMKAPLSSEYDALVPAAKRWAPAAVPERCARPGLIVDLTNTHRYYSAAEVRCGACSR